MLFFFFEVHVHALGVLAHVVTNLCGELLHLAEGIGELGEVQAGEGVVTVRAVAARGLGRLPSDAGASALLARDSVSPEDLETVRAHLGHLEDKLTALDEFVDCFKFYSINRTRRHE